MESSTQKGFGSVVSLLPGRVIVLQTLPGTPSAKAGLLPGDEILAVNGYVISRLDIGADHRSCCRNRASSRRSSTSAAAILRASLHFILTPEEMQSPSVERAFFVGAGVGYIRVSELRRADRRRSSRQAIEKLGGDRLAGLVLDLRNNPGGMVTAALADGLPVPPARARRS